MKKLKFILAATALCVGLLTASFVTTGCNTTVQRQAYNSLATTGKTVTTAYTGYLDMVLNGQVKTNDVPAITQRYREFKVLYDAACETAAWATNLVETPPSVIAAGGSVTSAIATAKTQ